MKKMNRAVAGALALVFSAAMLCSCVKTGSDAEEIKKIPEQFVEAFKADDGKTCEDLAEGYDHDDTMEDASFYTEEMESIYDIVLSATEVKSTGKPVIEKRNNRANMSVEISYLDAEDFIFESDLHMTYDEYVEALNGFKDRKTEKFTVYFVYDRDDKTWTMSKRSAKKIGNFLTSLADDLYYPIDISSDEAESMVTNLLTDMSNGDFSGVPMDYDWDDQVRVFEATELVGSGEDVDAAVDKFVAEYLKYILDHDHEFKVEDGTEHFVTLKGKAPSPDDLMSSLYSDEFLIETNMNSIRYTKLDMTVDELMNAQCALTYNTLADAIPSCSGVDYKWTADVYYHYVDGDQIFFENGLIQEPGNAANAYEVSEEQYLRCMEQAIINLYENGEINEELYEGMLDSLEDGAAPYEPDTSVSPSGYENQAVDAYEYVPDWCDDGSIIYGSSKKDENGYIMHYSEVSDYTVATIGYNFSDDGVRITCYFDEPLPMGDSFIVEWWVEEDDVTDSQVFLVQMNNMHEVEVFLSNEEFTMGDYIEMRIWESDHSHVVSYVQLYM